MKLTHIILVLCALSVGTPVFGENSTQKDKIRIGVVYGFTGAAQVWSEFGRMGLELAQDEINQAGGVHGKKIDLVYEDSRTNSAQSVSAYRKLVTIDNLKVVIGNVWGFITNPLIPLAERDKIIVLSPTVMPESVDRTNNYFFTMGERAETIRDAVDLFFKKNQDVKRIGIFCWDDPWGQAYLKIWKEVAEKNAVKVAAAICNIDFNNDFRTDVAKIAAKKVDAVIIAHMGDVILQRMREQGFSTKVLATSNLVEDIKIKKAPKELFEGIYITDWKPSDDFIEKFKAKFGTEPAVEAHNSYEALRSLAKALSLENTDLLSALKKVKYDGVAGAVDFSNSSFANYSVAKLYRVHDGEFELIN